MLKRTFTFNTLHGHDVFEELSMYKTFSPLLTSVPQHMMTLCSVVFLHFISSILAEGYSHGLNHADLGFFLELLWFSGILQVLETSISLFGLPSYASMHSLICAAVLYLPTWIRLILVANEGGFLYMAQFLTLILSILLAGKQVVTLCLATKFAVETIAASVLVSRVASGRFFQRILTPFVAETSVSSFSFAFMSQSHAKDIVRDFYPDLFPNLASEHVSSPESSVGLRCQNTNPLATISLVTDTEMSTNSGMNPVVRQSSVPFCLQSMSSSTATLSCVSTTLDDEPYSDLAKQLSMTLPNSIRSISNGERRLAIADVGGTCRDVLSTVPTEASEVICTQGFTSQDEQAIMEQCEIQFCPLMGYTKLDIAGFTSYCTQHGSDVVMLLNTLFTAFDTVLERYASKGVLKAKTIGDAYELMRPFPLEELRTCSPSDVVRGVAALVKASHEVVMCAKSVFRRMNVDLNIRAGMAIGPAYAAVIGSIRVSYDIFGRAPQRAR
ncbi:hypothetical protein KIPB_000072 [Kipferlia bialata]|uniref:adenylate cyclase n=1 Tax=Kipferlia bialata TaxID=797122 RepID=A0A9K3CMU3_9EUKA|nr:hypothetical protein KIPB_000072 [Kipferlia bialata]|eukprot:g72.t1